MKRASRLLGTGSMPAAYSHCLGLTSGRHWSSSTPGCNACQHVQKNSLVPSTHAKRSATSTFDSYHPEQPLLATLHLYSFAPPHLCYGASINIYLCPSVRRRRQCSRGSHCNAFEYLLGNSLCFFISRFVWYDSNILQSEQSNTHGFVLLTR